MAILADWVTHLRQERHWSPDDPLFPATRVGHGRTKLYEAVGLKRKPWAAAQPIRDIFREAFTAAGLPYFNPHSIRKTLMRLFMDLHPVAEKLKAWSQNLGHEGVMTTLRSYGEVSVSRQAEIMRELVSTGNGAPIS